MRIALRIRLYLWELIPKLSQKVHRDIPYVFLPSGHTLDEKTGMGNKS